MASQADQNKVVNAITNAGGLTADGIARAFGYSAANSKIHGIIDDLCNEGVIEFLDSDDDEGKYYVSEVEEDEDDSDDCECADACNTMEEILPSDSYTPPRNLRGMQLTQEVDGTLKLTIPGKSSVSFDPATQRVITVNAGFENSKSFLVDRDDNIRACISTAVANYASANGIGSYVMTDVNRETVAATVDDVNIDSAVIMVDVTRHNKAA